MTPAEHYQAAEQQVASVESLYSVGSVKRAELRAATALVHATLATAFVAADRGNLDPSI